MAKHYIKKAISYSAVGGLGFTIVAALQGCGDNTGQPPMGSQDQRQDSIADAAQQGVFMVIQQTGANPDTYELKEKYPSSEGTRAILKTLDGDERVLSEAELKELAEAEAQRVESGESQLTHPVAENQGLSLGETILASAAGALIGGMLANKLMGNSNFQRHQQQTNQRASSSMSSTRNPAQSNNASNRGSSGTRSGFFGGNSNSTSGRSSSSMGS
ncbi:MAG: hypothetical protein KDI15_07530 [Thiothrix sp.]|nr:hypothetical protein [Thiothrix sp.]HPE59211.1 hypothetical protein [Thiolinea sp.]